MNFARILIFTLLSLLTTSVWAHPGHDHQSVFATLVHLLWVLPVIVAIGVAFYLTRKDAEKEH